MTAFRSPHLESPWKTRLALLVSLGLAVLFRLLAVQWGLPLKYAHIDESVVIHYSLRIVSGALNPEFYDYPGLFLYALAGLIRGVGWIRGWTQGSGIETLFENYLDGDASVFTLTARALTVLFALMTVGYTFFMGLRWGSLMVGFGAATLVAVNVLHVTFSHYGTIDVAACFFTIWAMDKIMVYGLTRRLRDGAEAAFVVGLAIATKYYPGILFVPLAILPFVSRHQRPFRALVVLSLFALTGLFVGSPFTLISMGDFFDRFNHLAPKIVGFPGHYVPFVPTLSHLGKNVGPVCLLTGILGIGLGIKEGGGWRILAVLWLVLFGFLGLWRHQPPHYGLGLYPVLFMFSLLAVSKFFVKRNLAIFGVIVLFLSLAIPATVREIRYLKSPDTRLQAALWVRENIPPGSKILRFAHTPDFKKSDPFVIRVDFINERLKWVGQGHEAKKKGIENLRGYDFILYSSYSPESDHVGEVLEDSFFLLKRFSDPDPHYVHNPVVSVFDIKKNHSSLVDREDVS
jgi:hypothetical protein